jgi:hypothetical protein
VTGSRQVVKCSGLLGAVSGKEAQHTRTTERKLSSWQSYSLYLPRTRPV